MAIRELPGGPGLWLPNKFDESATSLAAGNTFRMDADGDRCGIVFRASKSGTLVGCDVCIAAVGNAPDNGLQLGRQGIDAATGLPDGTFVASVTTSGGQPSAAGWLAPGDWDSPQVVTRGELVCVMITQAAGFTASDSVTVAGGVMTAGLGFPYAINLTGGKEDTYIPLIFPRYSDGSYEPIEENCWAVSTLTNHASIASNTTPDELALAFTPRWPLRVRGIALQATTAAGGDFDAVLYDAAGRVLASQSHDADILQSTGFRWIIVTFPRSVELRPHARYYAAFKPTTTTANSIRSYYGTFPSAAAMETTFGGVEWAMATRTDGGAWTVYDNATNGYRKPRISILIDGLDDGSVAPRTRPLRRTV